MRVPLIVKVAALVLLTTLFYTYVGQMVPQKEVRPPKEVVLKTEMTEDEMVRAGKEIVEGKGLCLTCHTIGKKEGPFRFPDLEGVGARAGGREKGFSDVDYLAQALYEPNDYIVPGFSPGMPFINKPPIGLTDQEIHTVIAYLQSLGGTPTVTLATKLRYGPSAAAAPGAPSAAAPAKPGPG